MQALFTVEENLKELNNKFNQFISNLGISDSDLDNISSIDINKYTSLKGDKCLYAYTQNNGKNNITICKLVNMQDNKAVLKYFRDELSKEKFSDYCDIQEDRLIITLTNEFNEICGVNSTLNMSITIPCKYDKAIYANDLAEEEKEYLQTEFNKNIVMISTSVVLTDKQFEFIQGSCEKVNGITGVITI